VAGRATGLWSVEVIFGRICQMYLHNGWRRFIRAHIIEVGHFVFFKYDGHGMATVKIFDATMCRHHYHSDEDD
jgi:hypothetical protein